MISAEQAKRRLSYVSRFLFLKPIETAQFSLRRL